MKYSLVIKARSKSEAIGAAQDRGVALDVVDKHPKHDEVIASAEVRSIVVLQEWLNEDLGQTAPFPWGSLLFFSRMKKRAT